MDTPIGEQMRDNGICIGDAIGYLRREQGPSLELIAQELAMDANAYALMESNHIAVNDITLQRLAQIFNVSLIELLTLQLKLIEAKEDSALTATIQKQELERIEGLYKDQLNHLQEEARYLRRLVDSLASRS